MEIKGTTNLSSNNLDILTGDGYAPILKEYIKSMIGTKYESFDLDTCVPFVLPKGLKMDVSPEATRKSDDFESVGYIYEDEVNGIKRYFKPRLCRYADMEALHADLRILHISYCHGFKHEYFKSLISIEYFNWWFKESQYASSK